MSNTSLISSFSGTITDNEICKAMSGGNAVLADTALDLAYKKLYSMTKVNCGNNSSTAMKCLYLYLYALDNYIVPCFTATKTYSFDVPMFVYKTDPADQYKDTCVPFDTVFHLNGIGSDVHYINGIYDSNTSYWKNDDIEDMFRVSFYKDDVGVSGYSNRGVNEIGGYVANTQNALTSWMAQLVFHTQVQLLAKGVEIISCNAVLRETVTTVSTVTNFVTLSIKVAHDGPSLTTLMLNSNVTNEFNKTNGQALAGWEFSDILLTDTATHRRVATLTAETVPAVTESYLTEEQLLYILTNIEQISKSCC